jgi:hypothetical protein
MYEMARDKFTGLKNLDKTELWTGPTRFWHQRGFWRLRKQRVSRECFLGDKVRLNSGISVRAFCLEITTATDNLDSA